MGEEKKDNKKAEEQSEQSVENQESPPADPTPEEKIAKLQNEFLYLRAEFDNYRKNVIKERSDYMKYGSERVFVEFLEVFDNFERALEGDLATENMESFKKGVSLIAEEFRHFLRKFNVEEMDSVGKPFDPNVFEALSSEETDGDVEPGHVLRVFKKPYKLHEKVIRPGQVVVAKEKPKEGQ